MAHNILTAEIRIVGDQGVKYIDQCLILDRLKGFIVTPLQLDTDGEVITAFTPLIIRDPGMPGPFKQWHKLHHLSTAVDQQMSRNFGITYLRKIGVLSCRQFIAKELFNPVSAIYFWRQADVVQHDKIKRSCYRAYTTALIKIGRGYLPYPRNNALCINSEVFIQVLASAP